MSENGESTKVPSKFTKDVVYNAIVGITASALKAAAIMLIAAAAALFALGWEVPAWTLVLALIVALSLMYLTRRVAGREANELRPRLQAAEDKLDRHDSYGTNICSIMDNFQRVLAGDIPGVGVPEFIERGILTAGRDVMQENGHPSDLRMSILLAKDGNFEMQWASGHNIHSQKKYRQPIQKTVSRIAFETKGMQKWKDVTIEQRDFEENPHATRKFKSMVSIPLLVGDEAVGVFNVVTERVDAFDVADVNYLTSLGAVIQATVGVAAKDAKGAQARPVQNTQARPKAMPAAKTRRAPSTRPKPTPGGSVGSGSSPDGIEAPDD